MNKDLLFQLLSDKYTKFGHHISEIYDDPVFKKLSLEDQQRFIQEHKSKFDNTVLWTLKHPSALALTAGVGSTGLRAYESYVNYIARKYPSMAAREGLAQRLAAATGRPIESQLARFARHQKADEFAFIPEVFKSHVLDYLKSPDFLKHVAVGAGVASGIYLLSHLLKASQLKARSKAVLEADSPEKALINSHSARPFIEQNNPVFQNAVGVVHSLFN